MTQHLLYGKDLTIQGDTLTVGPTSSFNSPLILGDTSSIRFPRDDVLHNYLVIDGAFGPIGLPSPALVGLPVTCPAGVMTLRPIIGLSMVPVIGMVTAWIQGVTITFSAGAASVTFPGWLPAQYRPIGATEVPVPGQVGPVAQPTTLSFLLQTNGDVVIFKDIIHTPWLAGDTFKVAFLDTICYQTVGPLP